ncbi:MAG TPA: plastocyanin/azurin family copper-binding protein [Planctomycetota bacterium]|nr:plastocyanin/azurin family copper-binding protein [Planctomycetota bacterium]
MRFCLAVLLLWTPVGGAAVTGKVTWADGAAQKRLRSKIKYAGPGVSGPTKPDPSPAVVWLEGAAAVKMEPRTIEVKQEGMEFRPRILAVPMGSTVKFPNGDDVFHNVFSYSKAERFDLGKYPKGESKSVTFEHKGLIDVRCEVHDHMRSFIHVFDHPYYAIAAEDGGYTIPDVPPGKYTLVAWKEYFDPVRVEIEVKADGAKVDLTLSRLLDGPPDTAVGAACCDAR